MNRRGKEKRSFIHKLIAMTLCCLCFLTAIPTDVLALEKNDFEILTDELETEVSLEQDADETELISAMSLGELSGDQQTYAAPGQSSGHEIIVTNTITDAEVAYVYFTANTADNVTFVPVSSGQSVSMRNTTGCWLFFVKPAKGYLLTQYLSQDGSGKDLYGTGVKAADTNLYYFKMNTTNRNAGQKVLDQAAALGYVGYYGFTFDAFSDSGSSKANFTLKGERPPMTVTAVADPNTDIRPDQEVEFTVTITPGHTSAADKITGIRVESLMINGVDYKDQAVKVSDGVYKVKYTVTEDDWNNQKAHLDVTAEIDYEYIVGVTDRNQFDSYVPSKATITGEASADCTFDTKKGVVYKVYFDPADKADVSMFPETPEDNNTYFKGDEINVRNDYDDVAPIDDPENGGTWTFDGWYHNNTKVGDKLKMGDKNILLVGTWKFKEYEKVNLTVIKRVSGNMYDDNKAFAFTVTADRKMTYGDQTGYTIKFNLKKDWTATIAVPVGAKVSVTENPDGYQYSFVSSESTIKQYEVTENGVTFTMPGKASTVVVNNKKDMLVDTGVIVDTLPYVIILAVVVAGVFVLIVRRKYREY